jgi:hypothetical protein
MRLTEQQLQHLIGRLILEETGEDSPQVKQPGSLNQRIKDALKPGAVIRVSNTRAGPGDPFIESTVIKKGNRVRTVMIESTSPFRFDREEEAGALTDIIDRISPVVLVPLMCASDVQDATSAEGESSTFEMLGSSAAEALNRISENPAVLSVVRKQQTGVFPGDYSNFKIEFPVGFEQIYFEFDFEDDKTLSQVSLKPAFGTTLQVAFSRNAEVPDDYYRAAESAFKRSGLYDGKYEDLSDVRPEEELDSDIKGASQSLSEKEKAKALIVSTIEEHMKDIAVEFSILEPVSVVFSHLEKLCKLPDLYQVSIDGQVIRP